MTALTEHITIPRWKHHLGHAGAATAVAFVAFVLGVSLLWATVLGALAWPLMHEAVQAYLATPKWRDHIADFVQHQPVWIIYFLGSGKPLAAGAAAVTFAVLYKVTLPWSQP